MAGLFTPGPSTFVVDVVDLPDGTLKVYVGSPHLNVYCIVWEPEAIDRLRRAWADVSCHVLIPTPPADALFSDDEPF